MHPVTDSPSKSESYKALRLPRLKQRGDFLRTAKGAKAAMPGLVLQSRAQETPQTAPRVGFTVTRKVGNAVARNRAKRRLRAIADALLPTGGRAGFDYVLIGRTDTLTRPFTALRDDLHGALQRVHQERNK